jgi:hypothetical protein
MFVNIITKINLFKNYKNMIDTDKVNLRFTIHKTIEVNETRII